MEKEMLNLTLKKKCFIWAFKMPKIPTLERDMETCSWPVLYIGRHEIHDCWRGGGGREWVTESYLFRSPLSHENINHLQLSSKISSIWRKNFKANKLSRLQYVQLGVYSIFYFDRLCHGRDEALSCFVVLLPCETFKNNNRDTFHLSMWHQSHIEQPALSLTLILTPHPTHNLMYIIVHLRVILLLIS